MMALEASAAEALQSGCVQDIRVQLLNFMTTWLLQKSNIYLVCWVAVPSYHVQRPGTVHQGARACIEHEPALRIIAAPTPSCEVTSHPPLFPVDCSYLCHIRTTFHSSEGLRSDHL